MGSTGSRSDWVFGLAASATGVGVLAMALFPLAIPIVALTIVAMLPLAVPLIAFAAIAAILIGAWRGARAVARAISRPGGRRGRTGAPRMHEGAGAREALHGC